LISVPLRERSSAIATPPATHLELVERALPHGVKVIVCEKPLADTVANGRRMVAAARRHRRILAVDYTERYRPSIHPPPTTSSPS
jgi:predicted dehydrogenase